jgi:GNAT superfamily N-acetyltransferase
MEIRHVEIGEQGSLCARHPELAALRPELTKPAMANNPDRVDLDFPYLFYAIEDGRIVGHFMSFPDTLIGDRGKFRWVWNLGLYTEPEFRGRGIADRIVRHQLDEFARRNMIWGGVFSSPAAIRLYERLGFSMLGNASRLCLLRDLRPFLRQHVPSQFAVSVAGAALNAAAAAAQRLLHIGSQFEKRYSVEAIDKLRFAELVTRGLVRPEKFYWGDHASWFEARRSPIDFINIVRRRDEGDPCAFLITRDRLIKSRTLAGRYTGFKMLSVMEYGQLNRGVDIGDALVGALLMLFRKSDADLAEFVTSSHLIQAAARRRGFLALGAGMSFKFMAPPHSPLRAMPTTLADWHLSHYCGDAFGFE